MELVRKPTGIYWARGTDPNTMSFIKDLDLAPMTSDHLSPQTTGQSLGLVKRKYSYDT